MSIYHPLCYIEVINEAPFQIYNRGRALLFIFNWAGFILLYLAHFDLYVLMMVNCSLHVFFSSSAVCFFEEDFSLSLFFNYLLIMLLYPTLYFSISCLAK
jgi:hypothetical protein